MAKSSLKFSIVIAFALFLFSPNMTFGQYAYMGTVDMMSAAGDMDPSHYREASGVTATIMTIQGWGGQTMLQATIHFSTGGENTTGLLPVSVYNNSVISANNGEWRHYAMEMVTISLTDKKFGIVLAGTSYSGSITQIVKYP